MSGARAAAEVEGTFKQAVRLVGAVERSFAPAHDKGLRSDAFMAHKALAVRPPFLSTFDRRLARRC